MKTELIFDEMSETIIATAAKLASEGGVKILAVNSVTKISLIENGNTIKNIKLGKKLIIILAMIFPKQWKILKFHKNNLKTENVCRKRKITKIRINNEHSIFWN